MVEQVAMSGFTCSLDLDLGTDLVLQNCIVRRELPKPYKHYSCDICSQCQILTQ